MPTGITTLQRFCKGCQALLGSAPAQKWCSAKCRRQNYVWDSSHAKCIKCNKRPKLKQTSYCVPCAQYLRHNLTYEDVEFLKLFQGGRCSVCENRLPEDFQIDHDHTCCDNPNGQSCGQCVRGLLCRTCNLALGRFQDNARILENALNYIKGNR